MISQDTLERRVADMLRAKADQLAVGHEPFVLTVDPTVGSVFERGTGSRPARRAWLVVGGAVAACLLVGLWASAVGTGGRARVVTEPLSTPPTTARAAAPLGQAPSWLPDGLNLLAVAAARSNAAGVIGTQLFGDAAGAPQLLIQVQPQVQPGGGEPGSGQGTIVRGRPARAMPAKDFAASTTTVSWSEGADVEASFHGMSLARAEDLLATLHWASADHLDGFAPDPTSPLTLLGQRLNSGPAARTSNLDLTYADSVDAQLPGQGRQLTVRTTSTSGGPTPDFLEAWFHGQRRADGSMVSYDPAFHTLSLAWPDGRSAWMDANATAVDQAQLQQVADSLGPVDAAGYQVLAAEASRTMRTQLPLTAIARFDDGVIELHRSPTLEAVCLRPAATSRWTCSAPASLTSTVVAVSVLDGTRWLVAAAAASPVTVTVGQSPGAPRDQVPVRDVVDHGWHLALALPPTAVDAVTVLAGNQGTGAQRPG